MAQQQGLTDPDVWMQNQQSTSATGLTDPDQWMAKQSAQPATKPYELPLGAGKAEHIGPGPSALQEKGQGILGAISDPKVAVPALISGAAAFGTEGLSIPASGAIQAGVNAGATGLVHGLQSLFGIPQPPLSSELTWSAAGGAAPEALGLLSRGPRFFTKTPMGEQVQGLLGDKAGLHEVADHPIIDFMHNLASAGMGGRGRMEAAQARRSGEELQSLVKESSEFAPNKNPKLLPSAVDQGRDIRSSITDRAGQFYGGAVAPTYAPFESGGKYGGINVYRIDANGNGYNSTINDILKERSDIGKARASTMDRMRRVELGKQYDDYTKLINDNLPPDGQQQWMKAKAANTIYSKVFENPTVEQILQSPTKENEVLQMLYNPKGGGALGGKGLDTADKTIFAGAGTQPALPAPPTAGPRSLGTGQPQTALPAKPFAGRAMQVSKSNAEILKEAQTAMGKDEWQHTAVAAIQHIVEAATNEQGILDGAKMKNLFGAMDPDVKNILFGSGSKSDALDELVNKIAYAERKPKTAAGTLFINIRQGAAIMGAASAIGSGIGGLTGGTKGAAEGGLSGLGVAGTLMFAPNIMARILSSPVAREWLSKSADAVSPTIRDRMVNMAIKTAAQAGGRAAFQAADQRQQDMSSGRKIDLQNLFNSPIPQPPK